MSLKLEEKKEDERGIPLCSCGKPATYNFQENWCVYTIDEKGIYE